MKLMAIILISVVLLAGLVSANEETTNLKDVEYKQLLIQQQAKLQLEIRNELAKHDADNEAKINAYVDENFGVLDERINGFITKATFKLGMVFVSGLVLGGSILLLINNKINRKRAIKKSLYDSKERLSLSGDTISRVKEEKEVVVAPEKKFVPEAKVVDEPVYASKTIKPLGDRL